MNKPLRFHGAGGGGASGGAPTISPDSLRSKDLVEFTLGLMEGPIAGLHDGPKTFYADDTPVVSKGGAANFTPFEVHMYHGDAIASFVANALGGTTTNERVGVQLAQDTPVVRTTSSTMRGNIDRLEVRILFNSLVKSTDSGDQLEETAQFSLRYRKVGDATWKDFYSDQDGLTLTLQTPAGLVNLGGTTRETTLASSGSFQAEFTDGDYTFWLNGEQPDTTLPGYDVSVSGAAGKLYLNKTTSAYIYVPTSGQTPTGADVVTENFKLGSRRVVLGFTVMSDLTIDVRSPDVIEITGKTTSGYTKDFVKSVPRYDGDWEIQVTKLSPDNETNRTINMSWESYQLVTVENRSYDNLAVVRGLAQASDQFSSIPTFNGVYGCLIVKVPSNYDPVTRHYEGAWDGTWKLAHTDNPAWCLYDLLMNERYGLKFHYPHLKVDRYSFYDAARWCDELVPRTVGGYQPRFTYNDRIEEARNAIELAFQIAGIFGGVLVSDLNGTARLKVDKPEMPSQIFGVESGTVEGFEYSFSDVAQRPNDLEVAFTNPHLGFEKDVRRVSSDELIALNGRNKDEMVALGCNDVFEAQRRGYRRLVQANTEVITVNFRTARMGLGLETFDVIGIVDASMNWGVSGRVKSVAGSTIHLRDPLFLPVGSDLEFQVQTPSGVHDLTVQSAQPATRELTITSGSWPTDAPDRAQFGISSATVGLVKPFRVLSVKEDSQDPELIAITALEQNVNKYADVDNMVASDTIDYQSEYAGFPDAPVVQSVESGTEHLYINGDGKVVSRMLVSWSHNPGSYADEFQLKYRRAGADGPYQTIRTGGRSVYIDNVQDGVLYELEVLAINPIGRKSQNPQTFLHRVVGKTAPPSGVSNLQAQQSGPDVRLRFDTVGDADISHYEIRLAGTADATWETAEYVGQTTTSEFLDRNIQRPLAQYFVKAVDTTGNVSDVAASLTYTPPAPGKPTASISFNKADFMLRITPDAADQVPVDSFQVFHGGSLVFDGKTNTFSGPANWLGPKEFTITVTNVAGRVSEAHVATGTVVAPAAPDVSAFITDSNFYLQWAAPAATLPIARYEIRDTADGSLVATLPGTNFSGFVSWLGNRTFEVVAIDATGNSGPAGSAYVNVLSPETAGVQSSVSRSQLKLSWTNVKNSLPIRRSFVYEGDSFATATQIASVNAETFSTPVDWNGSKTFYVVAEDSAGNRGAPASVIETIEPPSQPTIEATVVDQNIQLAWADAATELLIDRNHVFQEIQLDSGFTSIRTTQTPTGQTLWGRYDVQSVKIAEALPWTRVAADETDVLPIAAGEKIEYFAIYKTEGEVAVGVRNWFDDGAAALGVYPNSEGRIEHGQVLGPEISLEFAKEFDLGGGMKGIHVVFQLHIPIHFGCDLGLGAVSDVIGTEFLLAGHKLQKVTAGQRIEPLDKIGFLKRIQTVSADTTVVVPDFEGVTAFAVEPVDEAGNVGPIGTTDVEIFPPENFEFLSSIGENLVQFSWTPPAATLPIGGYELRRGAILETSTLVATAAGNSHSFPADWYGAETFWLTAVDTAGNRSPAQRTELTIEVPTAPAVRSEVIDNNVLLRWSNGSGTLPVVATEIRKGDSFATAEVLQQVDATFATFFEFTSGTYTYWAVNIDSAGNYGMPSPMATVVSEPPDFVLQNAFSSDLSGTRTNVLMDQGKLYFGIDETQTFEQHFQDNGLNSPQDQIDQNYPRFLQPISLAPSTYQEEFDLGVVIGSSIITVTPTIAQLAGDGRIRVDIEFREKATDPWILRTGESRVYAQNFQLIRVTLTLLADSQHDLVEVSRIDYRLNVKLRNDAGSAYANAADAGGTQVNFKVDFVDVESISVTPKVTTPVIPVYDFTDTSNPTGFTVYLFDKNGDRVSGDFSWAVRGY